MNQTDILLMLAEQAKDRHSFDAEHALAILCRQISELDHAAPDFGEKFGEFVEIGVTLWHFVDCELRKQPSARS